LICNSTSIVALSHQILESIEGNLVSHVVEIYLQLPTANSQITLCKLIRNVPAQCTIFSPFLDKRMEEAKTIKKSFEWLWMDTAFIEILAIDRVNQEGNIQIILKSFCRFICDF
jgi:hypothetical protein